jgi:hypothetical protein
LLGRRNAQVVVKLLKTNRGQERRNSGAGRARLATCTEAMDRSDSWHDEAAPPTDNWLKNNIDPLIKSPALANSVFIIVFDESLDVDVVNGGVFHRSCLSHLLEMNPNLLGYPNPSSSLLISSLHGTFVKGQRRMRASILG